MFKVCRNRRFLEFSHVEIVREWNLKGLYCALSVGQAGTG
jgi:hypothetical protein